MIAFIIIIIILLLCHRFKRFVSSWIVFRLASSIPHPSSSFLSMSLHHCPSFSSALLFHRGGAGLSLNDRVPVEVVLDVVGGQHASHLEVSRGQSVLLLLLLTQLTVVA